MRASSKSVAKLVVILWVTAWSLPFAYAENSVVVESKSLPALGTNQSVAVFINNSVELTAFVLPLEFRSISGGAYIAGSLSVEVNPIGRLAALQAGCEYGSTRFFAERDSVTGTGGTFCSEDSLGKSWLSADSAPDYVSPDALVYAIVGNDPAYADPGSDGAPGIGVPSLVLTFDLGAASGQFEIDTTCVAPANHLIFVEKSEFWNATPIVPSFTKGVVIVEPTVLSGHISDHDTVGYLVTIPGDVTVDSSASLTIRPGASLIANAFEDNTQGGAEANLVEIIVHGTLRIENAAGWKPVFQSDSSAVASWYGIRIMPGGRLESGSGAVIQNAVVGITLDSLADVDSLTRLEISDCDVAGIWSFGSAAVIADNLIYDIPEGYGISVWDADPLILGNTITNCETGIDVLRSSSQVRGNVINGPGMHGIFVSQYDEMYPGQDTLRVIDNEILGYFSAAHLYAGGFGHCRVDSCEFISQYVGGGQSPYGIKTSQGVWAKVRHTKVQAFGMTGVYSYKSAMNLGKTKNNNGGVDDLGFNDVQTDSAAGCEEFCITRRVWHVGLTSTDTLRAEGNWWDSVPPPSHWFGSLVDWSDWLEEEPLGKIAVDHPTAADVPRSTSLGQNYPNPFNPSTTVSFSIAVRTKVRLVIYNTLGQQVSVLADRDYEPGQHALTWDGRDESGNQVASGVYFYRLTAGDFVESKKMVLLK